MSRASDDALDALHGLLSETLMDELKAARAKRDEKGHPVPVPSSLILAVQKFLKDNGIDAPAKSPRVSSLASQLSQIDVGEENSLPN